MANSPNRKTLLDLSPARARTFLLRGESYNSIDLPGYFNFENLLKEAHKALYNKNIKSCQSGGKSPQNIDGVNYTLIHNKDGRYAWRPTQLLHPALYVSLAHEITKPRSWELIQNRFNEFSQNNRIRCMSIPVIPARYKRKNKAEQILHWWEHTEQKSIELALEYDYVLTTDITDCYGSIYTHSIAWALHGKEDAKKHKTNNSYIGNIIDKHIRDMRHGQTNGIPQGPVLMDFVAEMVLGYADMLLYEQINGNDITDYHILRYRDDYRIFVNSHEVGNKIAKLLTEVLIELGFRLNTSKTLMSDDVISASVKSDKVAWATRKQADENIQKHLYLIRSHAADFPNSGSLQKALALYRDRCENILNPYNQEKKQFDKNLRCLQKKYMPLISKVVDLARNNPGAHSIHIGILIELFSLISIDNDLNFDNKYYRQIKKDSYSLEKNYMPLISIVSDIALKNPKTYSICAGILSRLFVLLPEEKKQATIEKIIKKFSKSPNTGHMLVWLQRISYLVDKEIPYGENLCRLVAGSVSNFDIWDSSWIVNDSELWAALGASIIDREKLKNMPSTVPAEETDKFSPY